MQECDVCVYRDYLPDYPPCSNCLREHDVSGRFSLFCEALSEDVAFETKQTNADRIRSMTDEEIEKWYWWMHKEMMRYTDSRVFVHDWLKAPAEEGE